MSHNAHRRIEAFCVAMHADSLRSYSSSLARNANHSCPDRKDSLNHSPLSGLKSQRKDRSNSKPDLVACEKPDAVRAIQYRVNVQSTPSGRLPEKQRLRGPAGPETLCLTALAGSHAAPVLPPLLRRPPNNGPHSV